MEPNPYQSSRESAVGKDGSRNAHVWGAAIAAVLTLATGILHLVGVMRVYVLDEIFLAPAAIFTWLFVLGDRGTDNLHIQIAMAIAMPINALFGYLVGTAINGIRGHPPDTPTSGGEPSDRWVG